MPDPYMPQDLQLGQAERDETLMLAGLQPWTWQYRDGSSGHPCNVLEDISAPNTCDLPEECAIIIPDTRYITHRFDDGSFTTIPCPSPPSFIPLSTQGFPSMEVLYPLSPPQPLQVCSAEADTHLAEAPSTFGVPFPTPADQLFRLSNSQSLAPTVSQFSAYLVGINKIHLPDHLSETAQNLPEVHIQRGLTDKPLNHEAEITALSGDANFVYTSVSTEDGAQSVMPLDPDHPDWTLSHEAYEWIFAVLYPKRRIDKEKSTPSGRCWLCSSVSKHAGSLQQHLITIHRQRLARKIRAGQPFNQTLALGFVAAHLESQYGKEPTEDHNLTINECEGFRALLTLGPLSDKSLGAYTDWFPTLLQKLHELCLEESWIGVKCPDCGTWATRRVALKEHASVCAGRTPTAVTKSGFSPSLDLLPPSVPDLRLTDSGLAARPSRGVTCRTRGRSTKRDGQ